MEKTKIDLINRYFEDELSNEEKQELLKLIKEDEGLFDYFRKIEILKKDLKEIKNIREKVNLEYRILEKIRKYKIKKRISLSLGFALTFALVLLMLFPFNQRENFIRVANINKTNHKYLISNVKDNLNIKEIEITLFVKDEKIEEKTGNLKIPKDEFNLLFETLSDKGDILVEKIEGGGEKSDYISIKINYKNYPNKSFSYYLGVFLPYFIIAIIFSMPLFFILKRKSKILT